MVTLFMVFVTASQGCLRRCCVNVHYLPTQVMYFMFMCERHALQVGGHRSSVISVTKNKPPILRSLLNTAVGFCIFLKC